MKEECKPTKAYYAKCEEHPWGKWRGCYSVLHSSITISADIRGIYTGSLTFVSNRCFTLRGGGFITFLLWKQSSEQNMPSEALLLLPLFTLWFLFRPHATKRLWSPLTEPSSVTPVSAEEVKASLPNSLTPEVPSELSQPYSCPAPSSVTLFNLPFFFSWFLLPCRLMSIYTLHLQFSFLSP